jgi:hypothetical protein
MDSKTDSTQTTTIGFFWRITQPSYHTIEVKGKTNDF